MDIIKLLGNGVIVNVNEPKQIENACLDILGSTQDWDMYSRNGVCCGHWHCIGSVRCVSGREYTPIQLEGAH